MPYFSWMFSLWFWWKSGMRSLLSLPELEDARKRLAGLK
jgi:hypothetical protein